MRRSDHVRPVCRERAFWRGAWVSGVDDDCRVMTLASTTSKERRRYPVDLRAPVLVPHARLRSLLKRRFAKTFDLIRGDAALIADMIKEVALLPRAGEKLVFYGVTEAGNRRRVSAGGYRAILAVIHVGPCVSPELRLSMGRRKPKGLFRFQQLLNKCKRCIRGQRCVKLSDLYRATGLVLRGTWSPP